ncbi:MAG: D-glycero-beta-D-manno-heptose-7-phosphate kinase [Flavobacteriales bacterium]|nr:D-glycero-beta-D-manno-heptose-7-phosphate kinase [Flavobacteriales bacterium]
MKLRAANIYQIFEDFNNLKVLIIGDVMVDSYYWGRVDRISPEAPVPIVAVSHKESRMGGAANVALNIQAMGATPILCSVIGEDAEGDEFMRLLEAREQSDEGMIRTSSRKTTEKSRVIGNNHQMLRIDSEETDPLSSALTKQLFDRISALIEVKGIDCVIFEDYDKGVITKSLIEKVVSLCKKKKIPTTVDPKKRNFTAYKEVTLFKPNLKELREGLKVEVDPAEKAQLEAAIGTLEKKLNNQITLITLSESGVYINSPKSKHHIPAHRRDIVDVSGAGDTVISVASLCLAQDLSPQMIAEFSNLAGGLVCENVGVVPIDKEELREEALKLFI